MAIRPYYTARKIKFSIEDFCSKCDQIRRNVQIWSHLLQKSLMENFIFCAVLESDFWQVFYKKKLLLKTFTKFKGKYLCCSLFLTKLRLFSLQLYQRPWRSCCVCSVCNFLKDSDAVVAFVQSTTLSKTLTQLLRLFSLQLYQRLWHSCCVCSVCNFIKDSDAGVFFWILWYFWQRLLYRVLLSDCFCPV